MSDSSRYGKYWPEEGPINFLFNYNVNLATQEASGLGFSTRFYGIRIFGIAIGIMVKRIAQFDDELWMYPPSTQVQDLGNPFAEITKESRPIDYASIQAIQGSDRSSTGSEL